jgi:hypothetical protein
MKTLIINTDGSYIERDLTLEEVSLLPSVSKEVVTKQVLLSIQRAMDSKAQEFGYDDLKTAITYRGDPNSKFAAEADGFFNWRSSVWTKIHHYLEQAENKEFSSEEAVSLMPLLIIQYEV